MMRLHPPLSDRALAIAIVCLSFAASVAYAQPATAQAPLRDPALPYASWGEAARETAAAIGDRPLARPADGQFVVGDAVIFNDDGKRYRAHVMGIDAGRYNVHYDGFGPSWERRASADALLGYQPGYAPAVRATAARVARRVQIGDEMEIESRGRWIAGRVIGVRAGEIRVLYEGQPRSSDEWVAAGRVRPLPGGPTRTPRLAAGRYGCTTTSYNSNASRYESTPKGTLVFLASGVYRYLGFAKPSEGRYQIDAASGRVSFTGGHMAGGEATQMVQRPGRFYLTAPRIGERWTCGFANRG